MIWSYYVKNMVQLEPNTANSSTSTSPARPEPERPSGAAASAGHAPWCRRTGAGQGGSPAPAGSWETWLGPGSTACRFGERGPAPRLTAAWRSQWGSWGLCEAASPTEQARPTGSDPLSQTGSPLHPGHKQNTSQFSQGPFKPGCLLAHEGVSA